MSALTDLWAKYKQYGQTAQKAAYTGKVPAYNVPSTTKAYSQAYSAPKPTVAPVAGRSTTQLAGLQPQPIATSQKSILDTIASWFTPTTTTPKVATYTTTNQPTTADYLRRKTEAEAVSATLKAPPTQAYVEGQGYVPYQAGLTPSYQEQLDRVKALTDQYSWLKSYMQTGVSAPVEATTPVETWQPAKDVFGQSQQGQSLLGSLQDWMAGKTPFTPGITQAQAPTGVPAEGGGKGFAPEEWGTMGRPVGGAYPGWGGVPPSGPELAKTAISPEGKYWWEGGTMMGAPTPEQLNTPEYVKGYFNTLFDPGTHPELYDGNKLNTAGEAASENFWDAFTSDAKEGYYTPEQIAKDPKIHEDLVSEMLVRDKYDQKWVETLQDKSLGKVITQVASQDPTKLPPTISQERLDAMVRGPDFATLYDTGYRSQAYQNEVTVGIQQVQSTGAQITYDPASLNSLTYANIEGLKAELAQISPAQWQTIVDGNGQITLKSEFWKFNERGETINKASWDIDYPPQSEMQQSEQERYIDQQRFYNEWYWSDEATAQRQKEREESYEYYQEKDLEGWKEYYAILDTMKLYPDASEYWSQAGKFAELRRKWETSGAGMTWDVWLQQFDFEGEWYALPPQERGEKKYIYSPRMIRLNY
jgi:hypothetical protein